MVPFFKNHALNGHIGKYTGSKKLSTDEELFLCPRFIVKLMSKTVIDSAILKLYYDLNTLIIDIQQLMPLYDIVV